MFGVPKNKTIRTQFLFLCKAANLTCSLSVSFSPIAGSACHAATQTARPFPQCLCTCTRTLILWSPWERDPKQKQRKALTKQHAVAANLYLRRPRNCVCCPDKVAVQNCNFPNGDSFPVSAQSVDSAASKAIELDFSLVTRSGIKGHRCQFGTYFPFVHTQRTEPCQHHRQLFSCFVQLQNLRQETSAHHL